MDIFWALKEHRMLIGGKGTFTKSNLPQPIEAPPLPPPLALPDLAVPSQSPEFTPHTAAPLNPTPPRDSTLGVAQPWKHVLPHLAPLPRELRFNHMKPLTTHPHPSSPAGRAWDLRQGWTLIESGGGAELSLGARQPTSVCSHSPPQETATWWQTAGEARWT